MTAPKHTLNPRAYYKLGEWPGLRWYTECAPALDAAGKGNPTLGAALIAATSPRCGIVDNLRRALRGTSPLPAHQPNLARAFANLPLRGPKVEPFRRALLGDGDAVPLDIWMARAYGISEDPTLSVRRTTLCRIRAGAKHYNVFPRDYAAAVWCGIILSQGREPLNYGQALRLLIAQEELWKSAQSPETK
jgi:hypothetical protein